MGRGRTALAGSLLEEHRQVPAVSRAGLEEMGASVQARASPKHSVLSSQGGLLMVWRRIQLHGVLGCLLMQRENSACWLVVKPLLLESPPSPLCVRVGSDPPEGSSSELKEGMLR